MLEDYAEKNGFTGIRHFTDDGISGTTFEREGLQAMLAEGNRKNMRNAPKARKGRITTVIVFFHALITVGNETIFFRAREMPVNNMIQPILI